MSEFDEGDMFENGGFMRSFRRGGGGKPEMEDYMDYLESEAYSNTSYRDDEDHVMPDDAEETKLIPSSIPDCPRCGKRMRKRHGQFGDFWGCSSFPKCRGTKSINLCL